MKKIKRKPYEILFSNSKLTLIWFILAIMIVMIFVNTNFFKVTNFFNIFRSISIAGVVAFGLTFVMVSGEMDMSFSSTIGLSGVLIGTIMNKVVSGGGDPTMGIILGIFVACLAAVIIALVESYFVLKWKMPSFFVTIAMQFVILGVAGSITKGINVKGFPEGWGIAGKRSVGLVPISVIVFAIIFVITYILLEQTKYGRTLYAIGGNAESARLSGLNVAKYKVSVFIILHLTAVLGGILVSSQLMNGSHNYGADMLFTVLICVIIGGAGMSGGAGSILGTLLGLVFMNLILNAMTIGNVGEYPQQLVKGLMLIGAIFVNIVQGRISENVRIREASEGRN